MDKSYQKSELKRTNIFKWPLELNTETRLVLHVSGYALVDSGGFPSVHKGYCLILLLIRSPFLTMTECNKLQAILHICQLVQDQSSLYLG